MRPPFILATILSFLLYSPQVLAQTSNITVKAGATTVIYGRYSFDANTCGAMIAPKAKVRSAGSGKVTIKRQRTRLKSGRCAGRTVLGTAITYRPKAGFRGKDKVVIGFSGPRYTDGSGYSYHKQTFNITVR